jgi:hypothetical protein
MKVQMTTLPTGVNLRVSGDVSEVSLRRVLAALS